MLQSAAFPVLILYPRLVKMFYMCKTRTPNLVRTKIFEFFSGKIVATNMSSKLKLYVRFFIKFSYIKIQGSHRLVIRIQTGRLTGGNENRPCYCNRRYLRYLRLHLRLFVYILLGDTNVEYPWWTWTVILILWLH
jgi:hypothetical protein